MGNMFGYNYLTPAHLKGFEKYKYSAIDTSPLSMYVMHPSWNFIVKFIPKWIAPNLITFAGFLCMIFASVLLAILDYNFHSSDGIEDAYKMPDWVFVAAAVLLFLAYNLDGVDGKQARKIGVSGPLGELFDHGLDSYIVFLIPFCLVSVFGRDEHWSVSTFRGYLIIMSVVLNFYVSHWEKYNTGTLYLPWGYDLSMWVSSLLFLLPGLYGSEVYKYYVFGNITFLQALEVTIHATGFFSTLPIAVYNVYLSYVSGKCEQKSVMEVLRPIWSILSMTIVMTYWALKSPTNILESDPRAFLFLYGTLFSYIASRLIIAEMSSSRCELVCWMLWPLISTVVISLTHPALELIALRTMAVLCGIAHIHFGKSVVHQICRHFKISCFTVPAAKWK